MKTRLKRVLSLALTALMLLMLVPGAFASEIVTSEPVIPGLALENAAEPEKSAADALYERLMACTTYDDFDAIINGLTEEENALLDELTAEQNAVLEAKVAELGGYDVATLEDRGSYTIEQGGSQTISISSMNSSRFSSSCNPTADITASLYYNRGNLSGYKISIGSAVPAGTYTLTVNYRTTSGYGWSASTTENTDTISITVTEKINSAQVFYLKTPTSDPDSNSTSEWCDDAIGNGTVAVAGATWVNKKNIFANVGSYVRTMPDGNGLLENGSWLLPKAKYSNDYKLIFNAWKVQLENELGVTLNSPDDIKAIYLIPYKISTNADGYHIDCKISVKTDKFYTALFWVALPDGTEKQKQVDAANYKIGDKVEKTTKAPTGSSGDYPTEMTVDGVKYVFDGWYNEADDKILESEWPYMPKDTELTDGTVNFYARYVKAEANLTIKKTLSGNMYDESRQFDFTVTYTYGDDETTENLSFKLGNNSTHTITIPVGASVTVKENPAGYTPEVDAGTLATSSITGEYAYGISFTMPDADATVTFNNAKNAIPDTGVMMDSLPYILILAVVVAVGAFVFIRKRREHDDD